MANLLVIIKELQQLVATEEHLQLARLVEPELEQGQALELELALMQLGLQLQLVPKEQ